MIDFVTKEDLADYMNVNSLPLASADLALGAAMQAVRNYIQQEITYHQDDVEYHQGTDKMVFRLRQRPVRYITEILVDGVPLTPDNYTLRKSVVRRTDVGQFRLGQEIQVTYTHGWDVPFDLEDETSDSDGGPDSDGDVDDGGPFVPADIRLVTLSAARRFLMNGGLRDDSLIMETIGQYSYRLSPRGTDRGAYELLDAEKSTLEDYLIRLKV